jgi:hypothetical protein
MGVLRTTIGKLPIDTVNLKKEKNVFVTVGPLMLYTTEYHICNTELYMAVW